jgi:hypothetical protein
VVLYLDEAESREGGVEIAAEGVFLGLRAGSEVFEIEGGNVHCDAGAEGVETGEGVISAGYRRLSIS